MGDTLVLYKSKRGFTRQYAEWIAEDLRAELFELSQFPNRDWEKYSRVIYCGGLYANSLNGIRFLAKNQDRLNGKKIIVVACGISYPQIEDSLIRVQNGVMRKLPRTLHEQTKVFLVRGGVTYAKLGFFENFILKMLEGAVKKRDPDKLTDEEMEMRNVLGKDFSFVDRSFIQPIVEYCR